VLCAWIGDATTVCSAAQGSFTASDPSRACANVSPAWPAGQASKNWGQPWRRRRATAPTTPRPASISTTVPGSGTAVTLNSSSSKRIVMISVSSA
jgi:hypothetical protein